MKTTIDFNTLLPDMSCVILSMDQFLNEVHDLDGDNDTDLDDYELYLDWMNNKQLH